MNNVKEIINKAIICASETEILPNQSVTPKTTISIASNRQSELLGGIKLHKAYIRLMEIFEGLYGRYRLTRESPWHEYLAKMEMEQVKKTLEFIKSGASDHKVFAPTAPQFYALWEKISRKKTPDDRAREDAERQNIEEGHRMINDYLLTMIHFSLDGTPPYASFIQSEASLRAYFERSGMHLPEEVKNLIMDKIRPLNEKVVLELVKRYYFWMKNAPRMMLSTLDVK